MWDSFNTYDQGHQNSFETLCNQLFERYLSRKYPNSVDEFKVKINQFNKEEQKTIFDLDNNKSVIENIDLLIEFDNTFGSSKSPTHSQYNIKIAAENKN